MLFYGRYGAEAPTAPSDEGAVKLPILGNLTEGEKSTINLSPSQKSEIFASPLREGAKAPAAH